MSDGKPLAEEKTLRHRFGKPGAYVLECKAEDPKNPDGPRAFEHLTWNVTVTN